MFESVDVSENGCIGFVVLMTDTQSVPKTVVVLKPSAVSPRIY